ncbi:MAG: AMP-binding protein [Acidobacteria bacterium]|nr:AMP-binding protein [Acidobacteriota bacterium]
MLPDNLGHLFDAALKLIPSHPAVFQDDVVLTFEELDARCNQIANVLLDLRVQPEDRVALMFTNDFRFLESFFGPMRIGAVSVPVNIRMGDEAVRYVIRDSEATVLIANAAMADRARAVGAEAPSVRHVIVDAPAANGSLEYDALLGSMPTRATPRVTEPDTVCMQPYTSGSTGKPKGVLLTHGGQIWKSCPASTRLP